MTKMKEMMERRIKELRAENEQGLQQLKALDTKRQELATILARLSGAIEVMEAMLAEENLTSTTGEVE